MTRRGVAILAVSVAMSLGAIGYAMYRRSVTRPMPELTAGVVEVRKGWGVSEIAKAVFGVNQGAARWFRAHVILIGGARKLRAGEYALDRDTIETLTEKLMGGKVMLYRVTVSEGAWAEDIATLISGAGLAGRARLMELIRDPEFARTVLGHDAPSLEGYLFPETYYFSKGMTEEDILRAFVERFKEKTSALGASETLIRPIHEVITLASIVEREARAADERPLIAAVFRNRERRRMPLESCVTVEYALGRKKRVLSDDDLRVDSPYNTYRRAGLPPGPVSNPGLASIRAALAPADTDYLFFVARGDGRHFFSRTWPEHLRAKAQMKRNRAVLRGLARGPAKK